MGAAYVARGVAKVPTPPQIGRNKARRSAAPETTLEYGLRVLAGSGGRGRLVGARVAPGWPGGRSGGAQGGPGLINSVWCETDLIRSA